LKILKDRRSKDTYLKESERILTDFIMLNPATSQVKLTNVDKEKVNICFLKAA